MSELTVKYGNIVLVSGLYLDLTEKNQWETLDEVIHQDSDFLHQVIYEQYRKNANNNPNASITMGSLFMGMVAIRSDEVLTKLGDKEMRAAKDGHNVIHKRSHLAPKYRGLWDIVAGSDFSPGLRRLTAFPYRTGVRAREVPNDSAHLLIRYKPD